MPPFQRGDASRASASASEPNLSLPKLLKQAPRSRENAKTYDDIDEDDLPFPPQGGQREQDHPTYAAPSTNPPAGASPVKLTSRQQPLPAVATRPTSPIIQPLVDRLDDHFRGQSRLPSYLIQKQITHKTNGQRRDEVHVLQPDPQPKGNAAPGKNMNRPAPNGAIPRAVILRSRSQKPITQKKYANN